MVSSNGVNGTHIEPIKGRFCIVLFGCYLSSFGRVDLSKFRKTREDSISGWIGTNKTDNCSYTHYSQEDCLHWCWLWVSSLSLCSFILSWHPSLPLDRRRWPNMLRYLKDVPGYVSGIAVLTRLSSHCTLWLTSIVAYNFYRRSFSLIIFLSYLKTPWKHVPRNSTFAITTIFLSVHCNTTASWQLSMSTHTELQHGTPILCPSTSLV